jgi:uncharacterized SAM-binding protein YcdF (DUF218 family)
MGYLQITAGLILGLLLRFGIPIALTVLVARYMLRLDARWKAEAADLAKAVEEMGIPIVPVKGSQVLTLPACWEYMDCPPRMREVCPAYGHKETPCWEQVRSNGNLQHNCRNCTYRKAILLATETAA